MYIHIAMAVYVLDSIQLVSKMLAVIFAPSRCPQFWLHDRVQADDDNIIWGIFTANL